ncbi:MAG: hypothetical protein LAP87_24095 [Acidobacteriia bacterium]|nr:hypothetical protein [Terriglobia bacterium]
MLYAALLADGMFVSGDQGRSWTPIGSPVPHFSGGASIALSVNALIPSATPGTLYAIVQNTQTSAFLTKLSPDGSTIVYSTMLHGHASMDPVVNFAVQPAEFAVQNVAAAVALDRAGNIVVAGLTRAADFPVANPAQGSSGGRADAFVAVISADGSTLTYATYLGGSGDDGALAVTADAQGNLVVAGQTWSGDFPVRNAVRMGTGRFGDAFVARLWRNAPPPRPRVRGLFGQR